VKSKAAAAAARGQESRETRQAQHIQYASSLARRSWTSGERDIVVLVLWSHHSHARQFHHFLIVDES